MKDLHESVIFMLSDHFAGIKTTVAVKYCVILRNIFRSVASIDFHSSFRGKLYVAIQDV